MATFSPVKIYFRALNEINRNLNLSPPWNRIIKSQTKSEFRVPCLDLRWVCAAAISSLIIHTYTRR